MNNNSNGYRMHIIDHVMCDCGCESVCGGILLDTLTVYKLKPHKLHDEHILILGQGIYTCVYVPSLG